MLERVKKFLLKHGLTNKTIIVGFSGGYDSMCLLDILMNLDHKYKIVVAHVHHNLRDESDEEAVRFVSSNNLSKSIVFSLRSAFTAFRDTL